MTTKKLARKTRTHRAAKSAVKSINTCTFIETTDGGVTISLNGKELYSGMDWAEGVTTFTNTILGIAEQEVPEGPGGLAPTEPHVYNPFTTNRDGQLDMLADSLIGYGDDFDDEQVA